MGKNQKPKKKTLSHLTPQEFDNPLLPLVQICCSETDIAYLRDDIHRFIRATTCRNIGFHEDDYGSMFYFYRRFLKHIELLYLLMHRYSDWQASKSTPFYQLRIIGYSYTIIDKDMKGETKLDFVKLSKEEVEDVSRFMQSFFNFRTLPQWLNTMDDLMESIFSAEPFSEYDSDAFHVYEYLEKLGEALFLSYEIRGKEYMLSHCADRFGIKKKKLVDAE